MTSILDSIEAQAKRDHAKLRREVKLPFSIKPSLVAFFTTPFIIAKFMFVPVFGQLMALLNLFLLIFYFRERRNYKVVFSVIMSILLSFGFLVILGANFPKNLDLFIGTLTALCLAISILVTILLSFEIVSLRNNIT